MSMVARTEPGPAEDDITDTDDGDTHNVSGTANSAGAHTHTVPLRRPNSGGMNFDWLDGASSGTVVGNGT
uniref:hypothetical protein n=1 Tax=Escherichia coli TaxID=562 RepID=UPI00050A5D48